MRVRGSPFTRNPPGRHGGSRRYYAGATNGSVVNMNINFTFYGERGGGGRGGGRGLARIAPLERPRTVGVPICCTSLSVIRIHTSEIVLRCLGDVTRVYRKSGIVRCCKLLDMGDKVASWIIYHYTLFSYILGSCSLTRIHIFAVCCLSSGGWSIDFLPLSIPLPWTRWLPSYVFIKEDTVSEMHWVHSYALNPPLCPLRAASVLHLLAKQSLSSPIGSFYAIKKNSRDAGWRSTETQGVWERSIAVGRH